MSPFFLPSFAHRKDIESVQQSLGGLQASQQGITEELRKLSSTITTLHTKQAEELHQLSRAITTMCTKQAEEMRQIASTVTATYAKQQESAQTFVEIANRIAHGIGKIQSFSDTLKQEQEKIYSISLQEITIQKDTHQKIEQLVPPPLLPDRELDTSHTDFLMKTQQAKDAYQKIAETFEKAYQQQAEAHTSLEDMLKKFSPPFTGEKPEEEQETEPIPKMPSQQEPPIELDNPEPESIDQEEEREEGEEA